jgi:hypothetical protein
LGDEEREVVKAAEAFLAVMDEGRFGQLRDMGAAVGKQATRGQYSQKFQILRDMYGRVTLRTLDLVRLLVDPPGQPKGRYARVQYQSNFERAPSSWEELALVLERDGQWRVLGYAQRLEPVTLPPAKNESNPDATQTPAPPSAPTPPPATSKSPLRQAGLLTNPPKLPPGGLPIGKNLIDDPSLEETAIGQLPKGWFAWLNDGPDFKCEVVEGGVTGKHCLQISGTGTRGVVFATSIPMDRTKRYTLKGRVKVEGEAGTWAVIKLNYFNSTGWLGVDDRIGVTSSDLDWKFFEKSDAAEKHPAATLLVPTCHIEGNGTAWFDDLEVIAYDREKLPENFDARHGRNNRMK